MLHKKGDNLRWAKKEIFERALQLQNTSVANGVATHLPHAVGGDTPVQLLALSNVRTEGGLS